ncbi:MAG: hypothetical protein HUU55_21640, partial [Myxococcales bacterium]|nr:hypothetical protein [Myxococcales bacterium]
EKISCDDGNACTEDSCDPKSGCKNETISCDDSNACTADSCDPTSGCKNDTISCDDNNACTQDSCDADSGCKNDMISCDDDNACTKDSCDKETGCAYEKISCDDGDACTEDSCDPKSGCKNDTISCDDSNACTADSCDPTSGCKNETISCEDNNACTKDSCDPSLGCKNEMTSCNDGNACTKDSCDPATGCSTTPINCNDNSVCTSDSCDPATGCYHGVTNCNDNNPCTTDSCDPALGCQFVNNTASCDDGIPCTIGDKCAGGQCVGGTPTLSSTPGSDSTVQLDGEASAGEILNAQIDVNALTSNSVTLTIKNTSPQESSTILGAPILTRLGFNLAGNPAAGCLVLEDPSGRFEFATKVRPFCGLGGTPVSKKDTFAFSINAKNPAPKNGIKVGETVTLVLKVSSKCNYALTPESFLEAPLSPTGGILAAWAAKFQVVGFNGEDSGCASGSPTAPPVCKCTPVYTWSEFIATAADLNNLPSATNPQDSRAGSVEINFNGNHGFSGFFTDPAYGAGILSLRNGLGKVIEQWQLNRKWPPSSLDANGCNTLMSYPQCWIFYPQDAFAGLLEAIIPTYSSGSNSGFDNSGKRVEISGSSAIDFTVGTLSNNDHESFVVSWDAPLGINTAQVLLRGRYDWDLDGLDGSDTWFVLARRNIPGQGPDYIHPSVTVLEETSTSFVIEVQAGPALEAVCGGYMNLKYFGECGCE